MSLAPIVTRALSMQAQGFCSLVLDGSEWRACLVGRGGLRLLGTCRLLHLWGVAYPSTSYGPLILLVVFPFVLKQVLS